MLCSACGATPSRAPCERCGADPYVDGRFRLDALVAPGLYTATLINPNPRLGDSTTAPAEVMIERLAVGDRLPTALARARSLRGVSHHTQPARRGEVVTGEGDTTILWRAHERVEGEPLRALAPLSEEELVSLLDDGAAALTALHEHGVALGAIDPDRAIRRADASWALLGAGREGARPEDDLVALGRLALFAATGDSREAARESLDAHDELSAPMRALLRQLTDPARPIPSAAELIERVGAAWGRTHDGPPVPDPAASWDEEPTVAVSALASGALSADEATDVSEPGLSDPGGVDLPSDHGHPPDEPPPPAPKPPPPAPPKPTTPDVIFSSTASSASRPLWPWALALGALGLLLMGLWLS